jgi:hypothetical protein
MRIDFIWTQGLQLIIITIGLVEQVHINTCEEHEFFVLNFPGLYLEGLLDEGVGLLDE